MENSEWVLRTEVSLGRSHTEIAPRAVKVVSIEIERTDTSSLIKSSSPVLSPYLVNNKRRDAFVRSAVCSKSFCFLAKLDLRVDTPQTAANSEWEKRKPRWVLWRFKLMPDFGVQDIVLLSSRRRVRKPWHWEQPNDTLAYPTMPKSDCTVVLWKSPRSPLFPQLRCLTSQRSALLRRSLLWCNYRIVKTQISSPSSSFLRRSL